MNKKTIAASSSILLGNLLEFYDFTLFAALLPIITPLFFPDQDILSSFNASYVFLSIGFFARPVGAIIFGYIGDLYSRKTSLILSIFLMSCATLSIGCLPSDDINNKKYIIIILALCRALQGLSAGGEYSGAGILLTENNKQLTNNFLSGSLLTAFGLLGAFFASVIAAIISTKSSYIFCWRSLFVVGGCLGFLILIVRVFNSISPSNRNHINCASKIFSWTYLVQKYKASLLCTIGIGGLMNVPFYLITGFINTYFTALNIYAKTTIMFINAAVILFCAALTIYIGFLSKYFNPIKMMLYASLGMIIFSIPFFLLIQSGCLWCFIIAELALVCLSQLFVAPAVEVMSQLFPYSVRYRGMAVGNCLGLAFLGGSTPYISGYLVKYTGSACSPAIYLLVVAVLGFLSVLVANNKLQTTS